MLTNIGNNTLNIASIAITGTNAGDFAVAASSACPVAPFTLAAGASCNIAVTFTPTAAGTRNGTLTLTDNNGNVAGSTQTISLSGTGTPSAVSLSSTAVAFGNQLLNTTSPAQPMPPLTLTNTGSAMLMFTSIKASGDFAETDTCGTSLAPKATCTISVTFTPTAIGPRAGAITISDNAPDSPQAITLSGNGTDVVISVPPGGSTSVAVSAGQSATFPLSLSPSGGFSDTVTVSCSGTIPAGTCSPSSSSLTLNAPVMLTMTVTTTAPSHSTILPVPRFSPRNFAPLRAVMQMLLLLIAFLLFSIAAPRRRRSWIVVTAGLFIFAFMSGCAGGSRNPGVVGPTVGTPANTYTVTVVVTTRSGAGTRAASLVTVAELPTRAADASALVFAPREASPSDRWNLLRKRLKPAAKKLGLPGVTWHLLRHCHATMLNVVGTLIGTMQSLLGHSIPRIPREIYLNAIPGAPRQSVECLQRLVLGPKFVS